MATCRRNSKHADDESSGFQKFLILFITGLFIIFVGIIILIITALFYGEGAANFGGVIFIWFIPIAFGTGPEATWMILLAIILAVLSILMFLTLRREMKRTNN